MADIKNINLGGIVPDKRMTVANGKAVEIKRTYKVVNGAGVIIWDIEDMPVYNYYMITTWNVINGVLEFPAIERAGKGHPCVIEWGDGTKEIYPDSATAISHNYDSSGIFTVTLWGNFNTLKQSCFSGKRLISIDTTKSLIRKIEGYVFHKCSLLNNVRLHNYTSISGSSCFELCTSLESIVIPYSTNYIDASMFRDCTNLKSVTCQTSSVAVLEYAFYNCTELTSFNFYKCTNIRMCAIACSGITNVSLGNAYTYIVDFGYSFYSNKVVNISIASGNTTIKYDDGCIYTTNYDCFVYCPFTKSGDIVIKSGVQRIKSYAFMSRQSVEGAERITSITIPKTVTYIESNAINEVNTNGINNENFTIYYEGTAEEWSANVSYNYHYNTALSKAEIIYLGK